MAVTLLDWRRSSVGRRPARSRLLARDFRECTAVARIDNDHELDTREQGRAISVCRDPQASWAELWPRYRVVGPY